MIPTISKGDNFLGVINYNENKKVKEISVTKEGEIIEEISNASKRLLVENFTNGANYFSNKFELADNFKSHNASNPNISEPVFHAAISFHPDEIISDELITEISKDYLQEMGYSNLPVLIYRHFDKPHPHVHVVTTRIDNEGKKVNDSFEKRKSQTIARALEIKYNLLQVKTGITTPVQNQNQGLKSRILQQVEYGLNKLKVDSIESLNLGLNKNGIGMEVIYNDKLGNTLEKPGLIFFDISDTAKRQTRSIKGKNLGKNYYNSILNKIEKNKIELSQKSATGIDKEVINRAGLFLEKINSIDKFDLKTLNNIALETNFSVKLFENSGGAYGWKIKDNTTGIDYKASDLHKELSFNAIATKLEGIKIRADIALKIANNVINSVIDLETQISLNKKYAPVVEQIFNQCLETGKTSIEEITKTFEDFEDKNIEIFITENFNKATNQSQPYFAKFKFKEENLIIPSSKLNHKGINLSINSIANFITKKDGIEAIKQSVLKVCLELETKGNNSFGQIVAQLNRQGLIMYKDKEDVLFKKINNQDIVNVKELFANENEFFTKVKFNGINDLNFFEKTRYSLRQPIVPIVTVAQNQFFKLFYSGSDNDLQKASILKLETPVYSNEKNINKDLIEKFEKILDIQKQLNFASKKIDFDKKDFEVENNNTVEYIIKILNNRGVGVHISKDDKNKITVNFKDYLNDSIELNSKNCSSFIFRNNIETLLNKYEPEQFENLIKTLNSQNGFILPFVKEDIEILRKCQDEKTPIPNSNTNLQEEIAFIDSLKFTPNTAIWLNNPNNTETQNQNNQNFYDDLVLSTMFKQYSSAVLNKGGDNENSNKNARSRRRKR